MDYRTQIVYRFENGKIASWALITPHNISQRLLMAFTDYQFRRQGFATHLIQISIREVKTSTLIVYSNTLAKILDKLNQPYVYCEWWTTSK